MFAPGNQDDRRHDVGGRDTPSDWQDLGEQVMEASCRNFPQREPVGVSMTRVSEAATAPGPVFSSPFNDFVKSLNGSIVLLPSRSVGLIHTLGLVKEYLQQNPHTCYSDLYKKQPNLCNGCNNPGVRKKDIHFVDFRGVASV